MEIIKISPVSINGIAKIVANNLNKGKIAIIPADTAYAIAANALNEKAINKIYDVKNRNKNDPIHIFINSSNSALDYAYVNELQKKILNRFLPGPYTFILKKKDNIPSILTAGLDTIGIRVPDTEFITLLNNYSDFPITATSANKSGLPTAYKIQNIIDQYGEDNLNSYFSNIIENDGEMIGKTSTIIDIINANDPKILRLGNIDKNEILNKIKKTINL